MAGFAHRVMPLMSNVNHHMLVPRRLVISLATASTACAFFGSCTQSSAGATEPSASASRMRAFLTMRGLDPSTLTTPQLVESAISFYQSVRAIGLAEDPQSDMLLFQWGVADWGHGEHFEIDMTRQFISAGAFGDDAISQLHCTAYFPPTSQLRDIALGNVWCRSVSDIEAFSSFIHGSAAYRAVAAAGPLRLSIGWEKV